ncbi:MAG: ParB/RepB/Spo0J family partition protein [Planctomycetia bacterium]|nr:ParB/RepB/Spo0J family partition protein [Planctomycetia bacterium]
MNLNTIPIQQIDTELIRLRDNNRDEGNAVGGLQEMATSMQNHGLLHPVLLRPVNDSEYTYECISGERRLRAAWDLNWEEIPARVVSADLSVEEIDELHLVENLQRSDLTPWEEARQLADLQARDPDQRLEDLADRVGKSPTWVAQRLAFHKLHPGLRAMLVKEEWPLVQVQMLARMPLQFQADFLDGVSQERKEGWGDYGSTALPEVPDTQSLARSINDALMLLSHAPWKRDDAKLLPEAGACNQCPKRSLAQKFLFPEVTDSKKDTCLDKDCWSRKQAALVMLQVEKLTKKKTPPVLLSDYSEVPQATKERLGDVEIRGVHDFNEVTQKDKDARPAVLVSGPEAGKVTWVKEWAKPVAQTSRRQVDQATGKPVPKTDKEKLHELLCKRLCAAVEFWRTESLNSIKPTLERLVRLVAVMGTRWSHRMCSDREWKDYEGIVDNDQKLADKLWDAIREVLQDRVKRTLPIVNCAESLWKEARLQAEALQGFASFEDCWKSAVDEVKFPVGLQKAGLTDPHTVFPEAITCHKPLNTPKKPQPAKKGKGAK